MVDDKRDSVDYMPKKLGLPGRYYLSREDQNTQALIGICGAQGSGKTVFMTSLYQTVDMVPFTGRTVIFDRDYDGGASYFTAIEREILATGKALSTKDNVRARLILRNNSEDANCRKVYVNLLDFAGRHFDSLAGFDSSMQSYHSSDEEHERMRQVRFFLDRCDGLIVLIRAKLFDISTDTAEENPMSASVRFLIDDCAENDRPLVIAVSQKDLSPSVDVESLMRQDWVKYFYKKFPGKSGAVERVSRIHLISCYELKEDGLPRRQPGKPGIWTNDASQIFLSLLDAALPKVEQRIENWHTEMEHTKTLGEAHKMEARDRILARDRIILINRSKMWRVWALRMFLVLFTLVTLGSIYYYLFVATSG